MAAESVRAPVTVRVYRTFRLPSAVEERALLEAQAVLRTALVDVRWEKCTDQNPAPVCGLPATPADLIVVVREGPRCEAASVTLGRALARSARGGVANIYMNCVAWLANASRTDLAVLLGRVIAHELGHLIIYPEAHARRGLMRANWTPREVRRNHPADWAFTAADVEVLRSTSVNVDAGNPCTPVHGCGDRGAPPVDVVHQRSDSHLAPSRSRK